MKERRSDPRRMTMEQLRSAAESNALAASTKAAELATATAARAKEDLERSKLLEAMRKELARDLGIDVRTAPNVLQDRAERAIGDTQRVWRPLTRLWNVATAAWRPTVANPAAARESRHVLAAMGELPAVRAADKVFGPESRVRELPPVDLADSGAVIAEVHAGPGAMLAGLFGLTVPREQPVEVETPATARSRTARELYSKNPGENLAMRARELELVTQLYEKARTQQRIARATAIVEQRAAICELIDRALGEVKLGEGWWWLRQIRRIAAREPQIQITDDHELAELSIEHVFRLACTHGAITRAGL